MLWKWFHSKMIQWTSSKVMALLKFIHNSSITQNAWGAWSVWWWAGSSQLTEDDRRPGVNLLVIQECRLPLTILPNGNIMWYTQFMNIQIYESIVYTEFKCIAKDGQTTGRSRKSQWSTSLCGLRWREIRKGWMVSVCLEMRPWLSNDMKISVCHFPGICEAGSLSQGLMVTSMPCWRLFFFFEKAIGELEVFGSKMIENMKPESLDGDFHGILSSIFRPEDHPFAGTQFADNICAVSSKYATSEPSRKVMAYKAEPASILLAASKAFGLVQGLIHFRSIVDAATKMGLWRTCSLGARLPARCRKTDEKGLN